MKVCDSRFAFGFDSNASVRPIIRSFHKWTTGEQTDSAEKKQSVRVKCECLNKKKNYSLKAVRLIIQRLYIRKNTKNVSRRIFSNFRNVLPDFTNIYKYLRNFAKNCEKLGSRPFRAIPAPDSSSAHRN